MRVDASVVILNSSEFKSSTCTCMQDFNQQYREWHRRTSRFALQTTRPDEVGIVILAPCKSRLYVDGTKAQAPV